MKFNRKETLNERLTNRSDATVNHEGGLHFKENDKTELFLRVSNAMFGEPKFYDKGRDSKGLTSGDKELLDLIHKVCADDPEFVLKLAVYAREVLYLRTIPMVLLAEYANSKAVGSVPKARKYVERAIQRPDQITELLAYQFLRNRYFPREKGKIPEMLKRGIAMSLNNFDEYQFGKWGGRQ